MATASKIDLSLLKKLVNELDAMIETAYAIPTDNVDKAHEAILELAKASGLAANISQEAALLVKDLYAVVLKVNQSAYTNGSASAEDQLLDLLGSLGKAPAKDNSGRN